MQTSVRLEAILSMLSPCKLLADVGTDHGLVPVLAVQRGLAERAIASDLHEAPLSLARHTISQAAVGDRVTTLLGDGLLALEAHEVDAVVMAGLSATLMRRLCDAAPHVLRAVRQLVIQPNSDAELMREWARDNGWHMRDERMLEARGRFHLVCAFARGDGPDPAYALAGWTDAMLLRVGPLLARRKDPMARRYCEAQCARLLDVVREGAAVREPELRALQGARGLLASA